MSVSAWRSRLLGVGLALLGGAGCSAPTPSTTAAVPRTLSREQALADLTRFQHLKEAADAGLYKYHPKAQLDSAFAAARAQLSPHPTVLEVYRLLVELTDYEGSLHNDTFLPDSLQRALHTETAFFPYPLKEVAGQVVVNTVQAPLPLGARLVSLNGVPARQLVQQLGKYYTTDGLNKTGKRVGFAANFPDYYRLEYGPQAAFHVRYVPLGTTDTLQQTLPAVPYARYQRAFAARHSRPVDEGFFDELPAPYTFQLRPAQGLAILTLNTFALGEEATPGHRRYAHFLDSCFTLLRHAPASTQLLVDVRNNGGGNDNNDMHTFAYLAHAPFQEHRTATVLFQRVPYRAWLTVEKDTSERTALVKEVEPVLHAEFAPGDAGRLREKARANPVFTLPPNRFQGHLYLLISERVASAGSMFAAMVRGNTAATLIGEETMGGYYGHTGHLSLSYTLPATGIQVQFSCVDLDQQVPVRASQPPGRGVLPDYPVTQSLADFLANRDRHLQVALALMARQRRPTPRVP
jgi:hypothetical protein